MATNPAHDPHDPIWIGPGAISDAPIPVPEGMESVEYQVGEPWPGGREWVAKRGDVSWMPDEGMFLIVEEATPELVAVLQGPVEINVIGHGPLVGLILDFDGHFDCESLMWRRPGQEFPKHLETPSPRLPLGLVLVDHVTKRVAHMRAFTLSPHASQALIKECRDRWAKGTDEHGGTEAFRHFEMRYPTLKDAKRAAVARCKGGD